MVRSGDRRENRRGGLRLGRRGLRRRAGGLLPENERHVIGLHRGPWRMPFHIVRYPPRKGNPRGSTSAQPTAPVHRRRWRHFHPPSSSPRLSPGSRRRRVRDAYVGNDTGVYRGGPQGDRSEGTPQRLAGRPGTRPPTGWGRDPRTAGGRTSVHRWPVRPGAAHGRHVALPGDPPTLSNLTGDWEGTMTPKGCQGDYRVTAQITQTGNAATGRLVQSGCIETFGVLDFTGTFQDGVLDGTTDWRRLPGDDPWRPLRHDPESPCLHDEPLRHGAEGRTTTRPPRTVLRK